MERGLTPGTQGRARPATTLLALTHTRHTRALQHAAARVTCDMGTYVCFHGLIAGTRWCVFQALNTTVSVDQRLFFSVLR